MDDTKPVYCLDASALIYSGCARKLYWTIVEGRRSKLNANDIEFGTAFHKFRKHIKLHGEQGFGEGVHIAVDHYKNTPMFIKPTEKWMTPEYLSLVCSRYFTDVYQSDSISPIIGPDGSALVEQTFALPYYAGDDFDLMLTGTIDEVGKIQNGCYCIVDAKTTSVYKVNEYLKAYMLSHQLMFYRYLLQLHAGVYPESVFHTMYHESDIGVKIDALFLKKGDVNFQSSRVIVFKQETIDEFANMLLKFLDDTVIPMIQAGRTPVRQGIITGSCKDIFGLCKYFDICACPDNAAQEELLDRLYIKQHYNPLEFQK